MAYSRAVVQMAARLLVHYEIPRQEDRPRCSCWLRGTRRGQCRHRLPGERAPRCWLSLRGRLPADRRHDLLRLDTEQAAMPLRGCARRRPQQTVGVPLPAAQAPQQGRAVWYQGPGLSSAYHTAALHIYTRLSACEGVLCVRC